MLPAVRERLTDAHSTRCLYYCFSVSCSAMRRFMSASRRMRLWSSLRTHRHAAPTLASQRAAAMAPAASYLRWASRASTAGSGACPHARHDVRGAAARLVRRDPRWASGWFTRSSSVTLRSSSMPEGSGNTSRHAAAHACAAMIARARAVGTSSENGGRARKGTWRALRGQELRGGRADLLERVRACAARGTSGQRATRSLARGVRARTRRRHDGLGVLQLGLRACRVGMRPRLSRTAVGRAPYRDGHRLASEVALNQRAVLRRVAR